MVYVRKRDDESSESLVRRFSRKVQESGVLLQAKKVQYFERKKSRQRVREEAQRRTELQTERDRLIKLGEIDEFTFPTSKRRR